MNHRLWDRLHSRSLKLEYKANNLAAYLILLFSFSLYIVVFTNSDFYSELSTITQSLRVVKKIEVILHIQVGYWEDFLLDLVIKYWWGRGTLFLLCLFHCMLCFGLLCFCSAMDLISNDYIFDFLIFNSCVLCEWNYTLLRGIVFEYVSHEERVFKTWLLFSCIIWFKFVFL